MTREEKNEPQRKQRKANGNLYTKRYEKTKKGFLMRLFRNMQSRVRGIQKQKYHLYRGVEIKFSRQAFYDWALASKDFHDLFEAWEYSNYSRKLTPTVDRISFSGHYEFGNCKLVTHSENSRRGALSNGRESLSSRESVRV